MQNPPHPSSIAPEGEVCTLRYHVSGMDCASCATKVEKMLERTPGALERKILLSSEILEVNLDEARSSRTVLEQNLRSLGYEPTLKRETRAGTVVGTPRAALELDHRGHGHEGHAHAAPETPTKPVSTHSSEHGHSHASEDGKPWYGGKQGRLVLSSGLLLLLAYGFGFVEPQWAYWGYVAATLVGVYPLIRQSLAAWRFGDYFGINTLVAVAALGAIAIGQAPEGAVVVFFFAIGELLEGIAAGRARAGIRALSSLTPKTATLLTDSGTRTVPIDALEVGQTVRIGAGERVPADGIILKGRSSLDDSPVTGESVPVGKTVEDSVYAGSINVDGTLEVRVDKPSSDNTIARIIHLVEEAEGSKARTSRFIDRFSRYWTPGVLIVSTLVAVVPPLLLGGAWHEWLYKGISLLLIGCPCALVLSVPAAITSGISAGARRGLLIKGGAALEQLSSLRTIAFDKTGTLTVGRLQVTDVVALEGTEDEVLSLAAALETGSHHPLAKAILEKAKGQNLAALEAQDLQALAGKAVTGRVNAKSYAVGSPRYAAELASLEAGLAGQIETLEEAGKTVVLLLEDIRPLALFALRDEARPDAKEAIAALRVLGVSSVMLTGDNKRTGDAIARSLGLEARSELLPADKLRIIGELQAQGPTGMVGDGINDAPALAQSDVGIAMGGGTDVALETADAALLRPSVLGVFEMVQLSKATMGNIHQNIAFALGLKAIFLVTTLLGLTSLWMAILADTGATVLVTANALRLLSWKRSSALVKPQNGVTPARA